MVTYLAQVGIQSQHTNTNPSCPVTSVVLNIFFPLQVNPGGSIPAMLVNLMARKQPLCVAYLRRMIENPNQSLNRSLSQSLAEPDQS